MSNEKHITIRFIVGAIAIMGIIGTLIVSITYYNVKSLEHPVKYEQTYNQAYERGN